jgi:hypothetical protein
MGVDLTIMPQSYAFGERIICNDALMLERQNELWAAIETSGDEVDVTLPVTCHFARTKDGETCYGEVSESPYGNKLTLMSAGRLSEVLSAHQMIGKNVWILAALKSMKPNLPIILYWH